ncbi:bifunctional cobalt-precorrin-7 (C(5))-methyltransferase/cobalt-precorrin-6B (C(15))-methyltransferase [Catenuloplanes japonicus]|uniref:bifunctional cobalt-precorrin-7 (C(5))-methyltransferase/cobalt-precorrin-6B (C(15))-methyltransferase n=1 Tax=Catenuloplanes japonicus TaxID=33876 RepID=UPI0005256CED|nr:bifunctional cobalt-precorrin-7 (C(5))-methyltransferase/cobalt-precorrin-6B (C(15))-methyltransferase [Catenuloplanes japonicus]
MTVTVVGIGADGWAGLAPPGRDAVLTAEVLIGSARQLDLIPPEATATRLTWPSPLLPALPGLLDAHRDRHLCVLASGDPMCFGIGGTIARLTGPGALRVVPHPSAISLACARLGWAVEDTEVVSVVGRPLDTLHTTIHPGRRLLVLSADGRSPAAVAELLRRRGYAGSALTVLENLAGPTERLTSTTAAEFPSDGGHAPLNVVAVECVAGPEAALLPTVPGLPDDAYAHDGQLTKREIRAITLARLAPVPGQALWDVGAGAGSIAVEWMRAHPACTATAIEADEQRAARLASNAAALGVPSLAVVRGLAPQALAGLAPPDAIFIGGGVTTDGMIDTCWAALRPGGRLVANAVTIESERVVTAARDALGGDLTRIEISRAGAVGGFTAWRPALPVTQWTVRKA